MFPEVQDAQFPSGSCACAVHLVVSPLPWRALTLAAITAPQSDRFPQLRHGEPPWSSPGCAPYRCWRRGQPSGSGRAAASLLPEKGPAVRSPPHCGSGREGPRFQSRFSFRRELRRGRSIPEPLRPPELRRTRRGGRSGARPAARRGAVRCRMGGASGSTAPALPPRRRISRPAAAEQGAGGDDGSAAAAADAPSPPARRQWRRTLRPARSTAVSCETTAMRRKVSAPGATAAAGGGRPPAASPRASVFPLLAPPAPLSSSPTSPRSAARFGPPGAGYCGRPAWQRQLLLGSGRGRGPSPAEPCELRLPRSGDSATPDPVHFHQHRGLPARCGRSPLRIRL